MMFIKILKQGSDAYEMKCLLNPDCWSRWRYYIIYFASRQLIFVNSTRAKREQIIEEKEDEFSLISNKNFINQTEKQKKASTRCS